MNTTTLTAICAVAWLASVAVRIVLPEWPGGPAADGLILSVIGHWFAQQSQKEKTA